jgi:hypothetical protein
MTSMTKLQDAFRKALSVPASVGVTSLRYGDAPAGKEWDSLRHMVLCSLLEDAFDVTIDISSVSRIRSFWDAVSVLKDMGVSFDNEAP